MKIILISLLVIHANSAYSAPAGMADAVTMLLTSQKSDDVKLGARIIINEDLRDVVVLDMAAQRLGIYFQDYDRLDDQEDTIAWLARALGSSENSRYRGVLEAALENTGEKLARRQARKVSRYLESAIASLDDIDNEETFVVADLGFKDWREHTLADRQIGNPNEDALAKVKEGDQVGVVYETLGKPPTVMQRIVGKRYPMVGRINHQFLEFQYDDIGAVRFNRVDDIWQVYEITSLESKDDLVSQLASDDPRVYRAAAQRIHRNQRYEEALLDIMAAKAYANMAVTEGIAVDAVSWLCNALGYSGNPRYRDILEEIADTAASRKLEKYAKAALGRLDNRDVEQYQVR